MNARVQYQLRWPPVTKSVIALAVVFFALWIGPILIEPFGKLVGNYLILRNGIIGEHDAFWSFATYAWFHGDFVSVLFAAFGVWVFGAELQSRWSPLRWWGMQVTAVLVAGLAAFAVLWATSATYPVRGYQAGLLSLAAAYCWQMWEQPLFFFFFSLKGRTLLAGFVVLGSLLSIFSGYYAGVAVDLVGAGVGLAFAGRVFHPRDLRVRLRNWRARRRLKVVPPTPESKKTNGKSNGTYLN